MVISPEAHAPARWSKALSLRARVTRRRAVACAWLHSWRSATVDDRCPSAAHSRDASNADTAWASSAVTWSTTRARTAATCGITADA